MDTDEAQILFVYAIIFVIPPLIICIYRKQSVWAILLNLFVSILVTPILFLWIIIGAAFGSLEGLGIALIFLFIPYILALIIVGKKELIISDGVKKNETT